MTLVSGLSLFIGEALLFILIVSIIILWREGEKRLVLKTIFVVVVTTGIVYLLKYLIPSPRPFQLTSEVMQTIVSYDSSFPSWHTAVAFGIATSVWLAKHRLGAVMLSLAILVGMGRVFLWVHFPIDVIVGGMIGAIVAFVLGEVMKTRKRQFPIIKHI